MARFSVCSRWLGPSCGVLLALISSGLLLAPGEAATTRVVTSLADPGTGGCDVAECTLREAIAVALDGDTITFDSTLFANGPGTITLTLGELVIDKALTLTGPGDDRLAISGNQESRVLRITTDAVASIKKVTITQGRAPGTVGGGGLYNLGRLTLVQSTVRDNAGDSTGPLYNRGRLTLRRSTVSGNTGDGSGGIYNAALGQLTLVQSTVSSNTGGASGGIYNAFGGTLTLVQSTVKDNDSGSNDFPGPPGGIYNGGTLTLVQSTVSGNTGVEVGGITNSGRMTLQQSTVSGNIGNLSGGLDNRGTLTLVRSTVRDNRGVAGGGLDNGGTLTLMQSTVSGNTAHNGGGLFNEGRLTLRQSTVSGNTAIIWGGGILNQNPDPDSGSVTLALVRSTISSNSARTGGGISNSFSTLTLHTTMVVGNTASRRSPDCFQGRAGAILSQGHNLTGAATGCPSDAAQGDLTVDPALVFTQVLGPLQDNGGRTFTHALLPGSPALDAGDPATCGGRDQRGVTRPQGAGCDIGAFELEVS